MIKHRKIAVLTVIALCSALAGCGVTLNAYKGSDFIQLTPPKQIHFKLKNFVGQESAINAIAGLQSKPMPPDATWEERELENLMAHLMAMKIAPLGFRVVPVRDPADLVFKLSIGYISRDNLFGWGTDFASLDIFEARTGTWIASYKASPGGLIKRPRGERLLDGIVEGLRDDLQPLRQKW